MEDRNAALLDRLKSKNRALKNKLKMYISPSIATQDEFTFWSDERVIIFSLANPGVRSSHSMRITVLWYTVETDLREVTDHFMVLRPKHPIHVRCS